MSMYTTGELAKLCGVSVRTVQYYDARGILSPSELSEGGRRLYSEQDADQMKIICFLRSLGLPIESIKALLAEQAPGEVIALLLDEQQRLLQDEIAERQTRAEQLSEVKRILRGLPDFSVAALGDIAYRMQNKKQIKKLHIFMLIGGFLMDAIQVGTLMIGILRHVWWPFAVGLTVAVAMGIVISYFYYSRTVYLCPACHGLFRPNFKQAFFARHTPYTRKLTCPACGHHGFCVETYGKEAPPC